MNASKNESADLPIEQTLIHGCWYVDGANRIGRYNTKLDLVEIVSQRDADGYTPVPGYRWWRLDRVAEYRPVPAEPVGLGAVVKDATDRYWLRGFGTAWQWINTDHPSEQRSWLALQQPVEVLSEGYVS